MSKDAKKRAARTAGPVPSEEMFTVSKTAYLALAGALQSHINLRRSLDEQMVAAFAAFDRALVRVVPGTPNTVGGNAAPVANG